MINNIYRYKLIDAEGRHKIGVIQAHSHTEAFSALNKMDITLLKLKNDKSKLKHLINPQLNLSKIIVFIQLLIWLLQAQIPIVKALVYIKNNYKDKKIVTALNFIIQDISNGTTVAQAFQNQVLFDKNFGRYLNHNESNDQLINNLNYILKWQKKSYHFKKNLKKNLTYPIILLIISLSLVVFLRFFLLPQILLFLAQMNQSIVPIQNLITAIDCLPYILSELCILTLCIVVNSFSRKGQIINAKIFNHLPIIKTYFTFKNFYLYFSILKLNLNGSIPTILTFKQTALTFKNSFFYISVKHASERIAQGCTLLQTFKEMKTLPTEVLVLIDVAEQTGSFHEALDIICNFFEVRLTDYLDQIINFISPAMLLIIGTIFIIVIYCTFVPLYNGIDQW